MYLMTASLLNSWKYLLESEYGGMEDFMQILHRLPTKKSEAMARGDAFETWAKDNLPELQGAIYQPSYSVKRGEFLLYGRLDFVKAGIVYDTKFSSHYEVGKFYDSPQSSMYLELVPEARQMQYIISNSVEGDVIWRETYQRNEVRPVMEIVHQFTEWLKENSLDDVYRQAWKAKR